MAGFIEARLAEMGIDLPEPVAPVADYVPYVRTGNLVFVSGQIPLNADGIITGQLTKEDHAADGVRLETAAGDRRGDALCIERDRAGQGLYR